MRTDKMQASLHSSELLTSFIHSYNEEQKEIEQQKTALTNQLAQETRFQLLKKLEEDASIVTYPNLL